MKPLAFFCSLILLLPLTAPSQEAPGVNLRRTVTVEVVERTKGAVVNISAEKLVSQRVSLNPFWEGLPGPTITRQATSLGSGFIIQQDGYVVTNNHVVDRAVQITVELTDGRKLPAKLLSADAEADLAILKISDTKPFPVLQLGDSNDLMIGEPAIAVGNPFGYSHSVSTGIISALHRDLPDRDGNTWLGDLIQTDAAINPGNSGGPLLNAYGQVVGINSAIRQDAQNIGFAIAVNRLRDLIPELMNPAQARKLDVHLHLTEHRRLTPPDKIDCEITTAAAPKNALVDINGHAPANIVDAYAMLLHAKAGQPLTLHWTSGPAETITPTAIPLPDPLADARKLLGITVQPVTPDLATKYGLAINYGMLVREVDHAGIAAAADIQPGDVIVQLDRYRVTSLDDLSALIHRLPKTGRVFIGVVRQGEFGHGWLQFGSDAAPE